MEVRTTLPPDLIAISLDAYSKLEHLAGAPSSTHEALARHTARQVEWEGDQPPK